MVLKRKENIGLETLRLPLSRYSDESVQTFDKQGGGTLDRPCFVLGYARIATTVFTLQVRDFQKSYILKKGAFVFLVSLDLVVIFEPLDCYGQGTRNQTLQVSKRGFDTFRLLQLSCKRWRNYLI